MVKIKICGLTRPCDIEAANEAGPEYIGFVFADSRRRITPAQALELRKALSPGIIPVGVFVNEAPDHIAALIRNGVIDVIQLHGNETEGDIAKLKTLTGKPVIKAVPVRRAGDAQKWRDSRADYLLLDHRGGGTGQCFDWDLIGETSKPFFLAGGLNKKNIGEAVRKTNPFAVDVSSGVETDGSKDREKIKQVITIVRKGE